MRTSVFVWLRFWGTRIVFSRSVCICLDYFYLPINSVLFLPVLLGEILAEECLNEIFCNLTLSNPNSLYNKTTPCILDANCQMDAGSEITHWV